MFVEAFIVVPARQIGAFTAGPVSRQRLPVEVVTPLVHPCGASHRSLAVFIYPSGGQVAETWAIQTPACWLNCWPEPEGQSGKASHMAVVLFKTTLELVKHVVCGVRSTQSFIEALYAPVPGQVGTDSQRLVVVLRVSPAKHIGEPIIAPLGSTHILLVEEYVPV